MTIKKNRAVLFSIILVGFLLSPSFSGAAESSVELLNTVDEDWDDSKELNVLDKSIVDQNYIDSDLQSTLGVGVLNPTIKPSDKYEFDIESGQFTDELVHNERYSSFRVHYNFSEKYDFSAGFRVRSGGLTLGAKKIMNQAPAQDYSLAPLPKEAYYFSLGYNWIYGKMSLTKNSIIPVRIKTISDFGLQKYGTKSLPYISLGIQNSFYLNPYWAIGLSVGVTAADIIDATSYNTALGVPNESNYSNKIQFNNFVGLNFSFFL